jgi:hypothetical protein
MRTLLAAAFAAIALMSFTGESSAQWGGDGCGVDRYGRTVCRPGAQPGVPYGYGGGRGRGGDGCGRDEYGRLVCRPGAAPGVPYGRGGWDGERRRGGWDGERRRGVVSDGCGTDRYGRTVCRPGARPGVPYYGPN